MKVNARVVVLAIVIGTVAVMACATPRVVANAAQGLYPDVVYYFPTQAAAIALTVDDGPDPVGTPAILDVLARNDAHATFFLIGSRVPSNEHLLDRMRAESHEVANHTFYERASILVPPEELEAELRETQALLSPYGPVRWFRPGSGLFTSRMVRAAASQGYGTALGDVFPLDPMVPSSRFHAWYILRHARPGSIVVLHDGHGRGVRTAATLEVVLPALRERGYQVVTLSRLEALSAGAQ